jgi:hypothetical protein
LESVVEASRELLVGVTVADEAGEELDWLTVAARREGRIINGAGRADGGNHVDAPA